MCFPNISIFRNNDNNLYNIGKKYIQTILLINTVYNKSNCIVGNYVQNNSLKPFVRTATKRYQTTTMNAEAGELGRTVLCLIYMLHSLVTNLPNVQSGD